jgi:hypothetical protein
MIRRTDSRKSRTDNYYIVNLFAIAHFVEETNCLIIDSSTLKLFCLHSKIIPSSFPNIRNYFLIGIGIFF